MTLRVVLDQVCSDVPKAVGWISAHYDKTGKCRLDATVHGLTLKDEDLNKLGEILEAAFPTNLRSTINCDNELVVFVVARPKEKRDLSHELLMRLRDAMRAVGINGTLLGSIVPRRRKRTH